MAGTGDPNGTINIFDNNTSVAAVKADASGQWHFDPSGLLAGPHSLVASETDAAGNVTAAAALSIIIPDRFDLSDQTTSESSSRYGDDVTGADGKKNAQFIYDERRKYSRRLARTSSWASSRPPVTSLR